MYFVKENSFPKFYSTVRALLSYKTVQDSASRPWRCPCKFSNWPGKVFFCLYWYLWLLQLSYCCLSSQCLLRNTIVPPNISNHNTHIFLAYADICMHMMIVQYMDASLIPHSAIFFQLRTQWVGLMKKLMGHAANWEPNPKGKHSTY